MAINVDPDRLARIKAIEPPPSTEPNGATSHPTPAVPPTDDVSLSTSAADAADAADAAPAKKKAGPSLATRLVRVVRERAELWHTPDGDLYATVEIGDHVEHIRLTIKQWRHWLAHVALTEFGTAAGGGALKDATGALEGIARYEGPQHVAHLRIAAVGDRIYIDLCDASWRAVEIDSTGWRVVERPPVRFERRDAMTALPEPVTGGSLVEMRDHVQISDESWPLVAGWLVGALAPRGPYPVLVLRGQHGAGKSHGARRARSLIDPSKAPIRSEPREPRDLVISARASHVTCYDNLSSVPPWLSDGLCRLATGGGYAARALYTDSDEIVIDVQRPTILTGITDVVTAPDLLDRCLLVDLEAIDPEDRETERALDMAWQEAQPKILGGLYTAVSTALERRDGLKIERLPRMADWATWATAAEPALGLKEGVTILAALADQAGEAIDIALDASIVARPICDMMAKRIESEWSGTAAGLLVDLETRVDAAVQRDKTWPRTAKGMASALARIAPALTGHGLRAERLPRNHGKRGWRIIRVPVVVPIVPAVPVGCPLESPPMGTAITQTVRQPTETGAHGAD
jgi:hypothetical protein